MSTISPLHETPQRGAVTAASQTHLRIAFQDIFPINPNETFRIDLGKSDIVFVRMKDAISSLSYNVKVLEDTVPPYGTEWAMKGTFLRDVLLESFVPKGESESPTSNDDPLTRQVTLPQISQGAFDEEPQISDWVRRYSQDTPEVHEGDMPLEGLNASQIRAVASMIGNRISLVQGVRLLLLQTTRRN